MTATTSPDSPAVPAIQLNPAIQRKQRTLWGDAWAQFRRNRLSMLGLFILVGLTLFCLLGPYVYTTSASYIDILAAEQAPSWEHPMGTDDLGRDGMARNIVGGRISLSVGVVAMMLSIFLGVTIGLVAGYVHQLDNLLMRFTDMMLALPQLPLLLVIIMLFRETLRGIFGPELGIFILIVVVIGILGWMPTARIVRGAVLSIKEKEFVEAATCVGSRRGQIMTKHILPNVLSPIIVSATIGVANAILNESVLSFLGLGFPSDVPTWGRLLYEGKDFLSRSPWMVLWPGTFISLTILGINFIGDGLRDALDPRMRN
jgi:peptide/nickel transport system permease protein